MRKPKIGRDVIMGKMKSGLEELRRSASNLKYVMNIMLKTAPLFVLLTIFSSIFSGMGNVVQSLFISKIIDGMLLNKAYTVLAIYAVIIIAFQLFAKLHSRTLFALGRVVTEEISVNMESRILNLIEKISLSKMDEPDFLNRMEQARTLTKKTPNSIFMLIFGAISLVAGTIGYIFILGKISFVYVAVLIFCSIFIFIANNRYEENVMAFLFAMTPERRRMGYFSELLTKRDYFEEIHAYGAVDFIRNEYIKNAKKQIDASRKVFKRYVGIYSVAAFIAYLGCGLVYLSIIHKTFQGGISLGDMTMFLTACIGFQAGLTELFDGICSLPAQLNVLQKYRDFIDELAQQKQPVIEANGNTQSERKDGRSVERSELPLVQVKNLSFAYPHSDRTILNHVSFEIKQNECVALVGENGAGKTTLVRLLMGFYEQYDGEINILGTEGREKGLTKRSTIMSALFQNYLKPSLTIGEAVAYAAKEDLDADKVRAVLEKSTYNLSELPDGIETNLSKMFSKNGIMPSGGQWQKLGLARMFYRDTPLYILDEPSASLDPKAEDEIFQMLLSMKGEHSILFITHRLASVSIADRVIFISPKGEMMQGTHKELMGSCSEYRELYQRQASKYVQEASGGNVDDSVS